MGKITRFKLGTLVKILFFLSYSRTIMADILISRVKRSDDGVSTTEINRPEENWIVVNEISCWESNGHWENEHEQLCPPSKIVTGHRFRFLSRTGLTGIQLKCTEKYGRDERESGQILERNSKDEAGINLPRGEWENWTKRTRSGVAVGFSFAPGEMNLRRSVKNYNMIYHSGNHNKTERAKQSALNLGKIVTKCPEDHAICGVKWMIDKAGLGILTALGLKCCYHCVPEENWEILHHHDNNGSSEYKGQVKTTVSLQRHVEDVKSDFAKLGNAVDPAGISKPLMTTKMVASIGKSESTGFDWTPTTNFIWTGETAVAKIYICKGNSSCTFKQLVGQCGTARVLVDKFCQVSNPIGTSSSGLFKAPHSITSCSEAMEILPSPRSAKQWIYPHGNSSSKVVQVLCDFDVDGGGWTVIQKRTSEPRDEFSRNWTEYSNGFGSLDGNFWLGLENIRALTKNGEQELRIELEDFEGSKKWAKYSSFSISNASDFYELSLSGFSGDSTTGDSMADSTNPNWAHHGMRFSTEDKDTDLKSGHCAKRFSSGWWFNACFRANLNGFYQVKGETFKAWEGIHWFTWKGSKNSLAKTEMKIRKRKSH